MVRQNGYAVEDEESEEGTRCIAAPVMQADGGIVASIGLAGPRLRMKKRLFPSLIPKLPRLPIKYRGKWDITIKPAATSLV